MYSRYILLSALLAFGAETYAKNNKTGGASLLSYDYAGNAPADSSYQDSIFKDQTLQEVKAVAREWHRHEQG